MNEKFDKISIQYAESESELEALSLELAECEAVRLVAQEVEHIILL